MLNNKQKFWLKFQKERILEIDQNSDEEKLRKRNEKAAEANDFIRALHRGDPRARKKVEKMIQYLQHGDRTTFDQKIIGGLFEEYCSDSEEEGNANKVMDTEEEQKEFYSLALPPDYDPPRKSQFNKGVDPDPKIAGFAALKHLYENKEGIAVIGMGPQYIPRGDMSNRTNKRSKRNKNKGAMMSQLSTKRSPYKKMMTSNYQKSNSTNMFGTKDNGIKEDYEGDDDAAIIDSQSATKTKSIAKRPESELDHTQKDFIAKAEMQIEINSFMKDDTYMDPSSSDKIKDRKNSSESSQFDKDASEGGNQSKGPFKQQSSSINDY
jgi:hypothetical protein